MPLTKNPKPKIKNFFHCRFKDLSNVESSEGLNSSLTQSPGKLYRW